MPSKNLDHLEDPARPPTQGPPPHLAFGYVCFGLIVSQLGHIFVYSDPSYLQTWFDLLQIEFPHLSKGQAVGLTVWTATLSFFVGILLHQKFGRSIESMLKTMALYWIAVMLFLQIPSSSIMRLVDESSFFVVLLLHLLLGKVFLAKENRLGEENLYRESWDLLRILIPIALTLPTIIGAGALVSAFYQDAPGFTKIQLYRRAVTAGYLEFGILTLLVWPVFKRIVQLRNDLKTIRRGKRKPQPKT